jgi:hypothetical protein
MAFSLKSLFRREQTEPNGMDQEQPTGPPLNSAPRVTATGPLSARPYSESGGAPDLRGGTSPFLVASGQPNPISSTPMNTASPFQPAAEEGFTIRELSILLPPQLLNVEQLPPDYLIPLPMEALRATFLAGRPCLRLSQIFQACPYLFGRQLMPGEDQEVSLPYQKVRRILEAGHGLPARGPEGVPQASPFAIRQAAPAISPPPPFPVPPAAAEEVLSPIDRPFKMTAAGNSPFKMAALEPSLAAPSVAASPFTLAQPTKASTPTPVPAAEAPAPLPTQPAAQPSSSFQLAPQLVGPAKVPNVPASPFAVVDRLPVAPAPSKDGPPAFPAPRSSSPFQIAQPPAAIAAAPAPPSPAPQPAGPVAMATPFAAQSMPAHLPGPAAAMSGAPAPTPFASQVPESTVSGLPMASPFTVVSAPVVPASPFTPVAVALPAFQSAPVPAAPPVPTAPARRDEPVAPPAVAPVAVPAPPAAAVELPAVPALPPVNSMPPVAPPTLPPPAPEISSQAEDKKESLAMQLLSVLRTVSIEELGFDGTKVPEAVLVTFPLSLILPQLPSGKVQVGLQDIVVGVAERYQPAFARASQNLRATLPLSELLHALPSDALPTASVAPTATPAPSFETPFQTKAVEDAVRVRTPEPSQFTPPVLPSFISAHDDLGDPRSAETLNDPPPSSLPLRGAVVAPAPVAQSVPLQIELPELIKPVGYLPPLPALIPAVSQSAPITPTAPPALPPLVLPAIPFAPPAERPAPVTATPAEETSLLEETASSKSTVEPVMASMPTQEPPVLVPAPVAAPAPLSQDFQIGYKEHPAAMALRHWLQLTGEITPRDAICGVAELSGVRAAVLLAPYLKETAGVVAESEAAFFEKSSLRHQSLKMMLENMGQAVQGSFTMRLDGVVSTCFLEGEICLAVLQDEVSLADALRDKLTLVTRELAALTTS